MMRRRRMNRRAARLFLGAGIPCAAAFIAVSGSALFLERHHKSLSVRHPSTQDSHLLANQHLSSFSLVDSTSCDKNATNSPNCSRERKTSADLYNAQHGHIPRSAVVHAQWSPPAEKENAIPQQNGPQNILIIGDVHGCWDELQRLYQKALEMNGNRPFQGVVLVGDLCNKGPESAKVIQFVRTQENWWSVRGNHDNSALAAALNQRSSKSKYKWTQSLSDDDVRWMADLPYTLRIPGTERDTLVVHAGLVPGLHLEQQSLKTMVTLRDVIPSTDAQEDHDSTQSVRRRQVYVPHTTQDRDASAGEPQAWASAWRGPEFVVFGHDAKRGLQLHEFATGLDTGAVYGKKLTGLILPQRTFVSVDSQREYSPVKRETTKRTSHTEPKQQ